MSDPAKIKARFLVTSSDVTILAEFKGVSCSITLKRTGRDNDELRNLRTLVRSLPSVLEEGVNEIHVTDQARRLDRELEELFRNEDNK